MDTLIMSCCANKLEHPTTALELYQSRAFDLVRAHAGDRFHVMILSAYYGLLEAHHPVEPYEQKMTTKKSNDLIEWCAPGYTPIWLRTAPGDVYVYGGQLYRAVIAAWCSRIDRNCIEVIGAGRGCGDHYSALRELLAP